MSPIEWIGIVGTLFIFLSMCFKTTSFQATLWLRVLNLIGSLLFVVYGSLLPAISTAVLNGGLILVNGFHVFLLFRDRYKTKKEEKPAAQTENADEQTEIADNQTEKPAEQVEEKEETK